MQQVCCTDDTQFATRMAHCEDPSHTIAGYIACVGEYCPTSIFQASLDGIVRISFSKKNFIPAGEGIQYIGDADNYISDHNGINLVVDLRRPQRPLARFNVISHNLEGLCYRQDKKDRYYQVLDLLTNYFEPYVTSGTVMILQELALQLHKKNPARQQIILNRNMETVLTHLRGLNPKLTGITDGYTGGIIYDSSYWDIIRELKISRQGSPKFSNAYLMKFLLYPELHVWFVNIHLKAFGSSLSSQKSINNAHTTELANILDTVFSNNEEGYPVYLCGDFNNPSVKYQLVIQALGKFQHPYEIWHPSEAQDDLGTYSFVQEDEPDSSSLVPKDRPLTREELSLLHDAIGT